MIEIKLSQGAKPGKGGVLPASKITTEIALTRDIPMGIDCISPPTHPEFSTPTELVHFGNACVNYLAENLSALSFVSVCRGSLWQLLKP